MAGRRMVRRKPLIEDFDRWTATQDGRGQWRIVSERTGLDPLRNPDPFERALAAHLAADAPGMRAFCRAVVPRLFTSDWASRDRRYRTISEFGTNFLYCGPTSWVMNRILPMKGEPELPLDNEDSDSAA